MLMLDRATQSMKALDLNTDFRQFLSLSHAGEGEGRSRIEGDGRRL